MKRFKKRFNGGCAIAEALLLSSAWRVWGPRSMLLLIFCAFLSACSDSLSKRSESPETKSAKLNTSEPQDSTRRTQSEVKELIARELVQPISNEITKQPPNKTIEEFKRRFNARAVKLNKALVIEGSGDETTSRTYFQYHFTKDTILNVYTDEELTKIESLELDSSKTDAIKFWQCVDACLAAVKSDQTDEQRAAILTQLSSGDNQAFPVRSCELDDGRYTFDVNLLAYDTGYGTIAKQDECSFNMNLFAP
ncbi:hypothetical protein KF728_07235 [Candidatus Obscuribacterales bacterium]|nr:hypothetical protein [Candidatus Obscuribacterales bacterium]